MFPFIGLCHICGLNKSTQDEQGGGNYCGLDFIVFISCGGEGNQPYPISPIEARMTKGRKKEKVMVVIILLDNKCYVSNPVLDALLSVI